MKRQNLFSDLSHLFSDLCEGDEEDTGSRHLTFWRPDNARMGATLYEFAPGAPGGRLHMHFGAEEMFFVLSGRPVLRTHRGEEELSPGDFVLCPEGRAGLHTFSNPREEPARILAISAGSFPDVVAYPEDGYAWVATRDPDPELLARGGDPGIIARFEIPIEYRSAFRSSPPTVPLVDELQREVEAADPAALDVDEEPRLAEIVTGRRKGTWTTADFDPAAAGLLPKGEVPHEAVPEVEAWIPHRHVTRPERDSAPDTEAISRPVVRS